MFLWDISQFQSFILYITKKNHVNWKFKLFGSETCYKSQLYSVFLHAYFFSKGLSISYVMDIIVSLAGVWESLGHLLFTFWALVLGGGCCVEKHGKGTHANECEIYASWDRDPCTVELRYLKNWLLEQHLYIEVIWKYMYKPQFLYEL